MQLPRIDNVKPLHFVDSKGRHIKVHDDYLVIDGHHMMLHECGSGFLQHSKECPCRKKEVK